MAEKKEELLKFNAEVSKVLQLMIHSLYTNKDIFLRELISNASDACDKLRHEAITSPDLTKGDSEFKIAISVDKKARTVTVSDNGVGMSRDELIANLGTIAKSGTQEFLAQLEQSKSKDMPLIGQFGVGFYSSFMVSDKVTVVSKRAGSDESWVWESKGEGEFTVSTLSHRERGGASLGEGAPTQSISQGPHPSPLPEGEGAIRGTSITLHLKEGIDEYLDTFRLRRIVQTYSDHISFPITITDDEGKSEVVNTASALWMRPKSDITPEQYKEFYHHVAHSPDEPWLTLHNKAEGKLEYTNLLFIPSLKAFDIFHPDRKRRVKLYVKRVFITEENVDVIPHWLRFLRGVVDSEDLPLNISRETLQSNPMLAKIRDSVTKRVLSELKKKADDDEASYTGFWKNFGAVLKEGLCEGTSPRENILEVCRFHSTFISPSPLGGGQGWGHESKDLSADAPLPSSPLQGEGFVSLDAYIGRMKPEQGEIYYLTGERLDVMRAHPQLEGFAKRGIEVLLMNDHVDDFWVNVVAEYKGKKLTSVTRANIELDKVAPDAKEEKKPETPEHKEEVAALCRRIKEVLAEHVRDVRPTDKLTSSAVCLGVEEGAMDIRLERFLVEQKQLTNTTAKILEVNPEHPIIKALSALSLQIKPSPSGRGLGEGASSPLTSPSGKDPHPSPLPQGEGTVAHTEFSDVVWLLFDQARILEGETITDPAAFTRRLQGFVEKGMAA